MKINLLFIFVLPILACYHTSVAQTVEPKGEDKTVTVSQQFVDDAAKAFDLVFEQREALRARAATQQLTKEEREAADKLLVALDKLLDVKDRTIAAVEKLAALYEKAVTVLTVIVERMEKLVQIAETKKEKPSLWQTFKNILTAVVVIISLRKLVT